MTTVTTQQAQTQFSEIAKMVTAENPVTITTQGQPELMLMRHDEAVEALRLLAAKKLSHWLKTRPDNLHDPLDEMSEAELSAMIEAERDAVYAERYGK